MLEITHPTEAELEGVLHFAFGHLPANEFSLRIASMMLQYQTGRIDLQGIVQAKHAGQLVGVLYAQTRPDNSVMLWIPAMEPGFPLEPMFEPFLQFCRSKNAFAAIAIADRNQSFDEQAFCSAGQFRSLSDLVYLVSELSPDDAPAKPSRLQFIPLSDYAEDVSERLIRLVKETYLDTLDFPELMQIAPVEQVLQTYKTEAPYRPELWFFIQRDGIDVGVLFLTDSGPEQFELTYMGLITSVRGQGLSREIIHFAKAITFQENRFLLLTSVDGQNHPACQTYLSQGFKAWDRKKLYIRFFPAWNP
ncbi:MAG: hypothetical protein FWG73_00100 [Planctomycetaceae bacterium]|nr:hypothetical protein [Planctomycetaceae bacterium]